MTIKHFHRKEHQKHFIQQGIIKFHSVTKLTCISNSYTYLPVQPSFAKPVHKEVAIFKLACAHRRLLHLILSSWGREGTLYVSFLPICIVFIGFEPFKLYWI